MHFEKHDVDELYKSIDIKAGSYIEVKENEAVVKIKKKWPMVDQILSSCAQSSSIQPDKAT